MAIETTRWDAADHLNTAEGIAAYLKAVFEDGDPALIAAALGDIARSKGMTKVAKEAGVGDGWNKLLRPVLIEQDDNGTLLITCPSIPGVVTFAASPREIVLRANEAIEAALAAGFESIDKPD
jgi:probable addiction module antidote protein